MSHARRSGSHRRPSERHGIRDDLYRYLRDDPRTHRVIRMMGTMTSAASGQVTTGDPMTEQGKEWTGWYFASESETLRYGDGRKIVVGETHKVDCEPILCERGLHASPTVLKALDYAPGPILFRVTLSGAIAHSDDKSCATERTYLDRIDATPILREFARKCALQVIHLWDCPRIVREYLETGDEKKRAAAWDAAWDAARDVARDAASDVARDAAWAAAWDAARAAAWDAARAVARDAAWAAAWDAARAAARAAAWAVARAAAWDVAWDAARAAARAAQEKMLDEMVLAAIAAQGSPVVTEPQSPQVSDSGLSHD